MIGLQELRRRRGACLRLMEEKQLDAIVIKAADGDTAPVNGMYRYLTGRGIDPGRILQEDRSVSTRENLLFSAKVLRDAQEASGQEKSRVTEEASGQEKSRDSEGSPDLEAAGARNAAIVTNEFHACRALLIAKDLGLEAGAVPAATPWWLFPTFYVRELYGILYQILL
mgnify:CR=1 FL=1